VADLLLYDGTCGLCSRSVRFVLRRDRVGRFRFAPLQGRLAGPLLARHGLDLADLDSVRLVTDHGGPGERVLSRSAAVLHVLGVLGLPWSLGRIFGLLPARWLDALYDRIAARRYRWFGRRDVCSALEPALRARFLEDVVAPAEPPR
jgi:predicted DCC family thiol-disulfide oxidoreductase YuxK